MRFATRSFFAGIVAVLAVGALGGVAVVYSGFIPANADAKPSKFERWAAVTSLHATLHREADGLQSPIADSDVAITEGAHLYQANCAVCHGVDRKDRTRIAQGLYQRPPQFVDDGVTDDPIGETYWKIKHGIRLTAMPAYSSSLTDKQVWEISLFMKHMDALPSHAMVAWKTMQLPK